MKTWYLTKKTLTDNGNDIGFETTTIRQTNEATGEISWVSGSTIQMADDLEALRVRIDAELQIVKGELQDETRGVDYFGIILADVPIQMKAQEISRVLLTLPDISSVTMTGASLDPRTRALMMNFEIQSTYGIIEYNKTFDINQ